MSKFLLCLTLSEAVLLLLYLSNQNAATEAAANKPEQAAKEQNKQPLAGVDQVLKQASRARIDEMMDQKVVANMSLVLNDLAANLRKMFAENKRLNSQVQEVLQRVQNATGVNATNTFKNLQQQQSTTNLTSLSNMNLASLMPRFNN